MALFALIAVPVRPYCNATDESQLCDSEFGELVGGEQGANIQRVISNGVY